MRVIQGVVLAMVTAGSLAHADYYSRGNQQVHCKPQDQACLQSQFVDKNQLMSPGNLPEHSYDSQGRLIRERVGTTTTYYSYDKDANHPRKYQETIKFGAKRGVPVIPGLSAQPH